MTEPNKTLRQNCTVHRGIVSATPLTITQISLFFH